MKVITVRQPWASLIADGYKEYEFRTWKTNYRGELLIHAGKGIDKKYLDRFKHLNLDYPVGCIIAKVSVTDCIYITDEIANKIYAKDSIVYNNLLNRTNWVGYGFKLENLRKIKPIKINGKLSLWDYDGDIEYV